MIRYQQLNVFKKLYYSILARSNAYKQKIRFTKMRNLNQLSDQIHSGKNNTNISYRMNWLKFQHEKVLGEWDCVTDIINGGQSTADLYFDKQNKLVSFQGFVQTKDKDRMIFYPYINLTKTYPSWIKLGPMRLLQVQVQTDGRPVQIHINMRSLIKGEVNIYGFILSRSTDWHTYEIPIQNMILRGTQQDYHQGVRQMGRSDNYLSKRNQTSIFDKQFQNLKKILRTQLADQNSLQIQNIGFRLVNTEASRQRNIKIKNVNFAYKKGYESFVKSYQSPYFYIINDTVLPQKQSKLIQYLSNDLSQMNAIDTGDIVYRKNNKK